MKRYKVYSWDLTSQKYFKDDRGIDLEKYLLKNDFTTSSYGSLAYEFDNKDKAIIYSMKYTETNNNNIVRIWDAEEKCWFN